MKAKLSVCGLALCAVSLLAGDVSIKVVQAGSGFAIFGREYSRWSVSAVNTSTNKLVVAGVILFSKASQTPPLPSSPPKLRLPGSEPRVVGWTWNDAWLDRGVQCSCLRTVELQSVSQVEMLYDGRSYKDGRKGWGYLDPGEKVDIGEWFACDADVLSNGYGEFTSHVFGPGGEEL